SLKIKGVKSSVLKELFEKYKNLEQIKSASIEELMQIKGVGRKTAERILQETNKVLRNQK
ncbi:MAG: helix-hairpin-helix domain-containing protein, partial [candidate division WOR-3 bacterium]